MNASGKTTSSAPWDAASAAISAIFSTVASRSKMTGSAWTQATVTARSTRRSLLSPEAAASRRLDRDHVAGGERPGDLRGKLFAVQAIPARRSRSSAALSLRRMGAPLADDRESAVLECTQLAHHAVAAPVPPVSPRARPQRVPLHPQRIRELERLDRRVQGVR